jgi:hypothetical protein
MAHPNIDERRFFVAKLLSGGIEIDLSVKKKVAAKFDCHVSAIYADCKHFSKNGWHWELNNGPKYDSAEEIDYFTQELRIYSPEESQKYIAQTKYGNRLIQYFHNHPEKLYELTPRQFEEFTAELLQRFGYKVRLSPKGPDEGIDILAEKQGKVGDELMLVQCKRFQKNKKVSRPIIQQLNSNIYDKNASSGLVVTTSSFSKSALEYIAQAKYRLRGADHIKIKEWLTALNNKEILQIN